jgi:hypothetical protein
VLVETLVELVVTVGVSVVVFAWVCHLYSLI